MSESPPWSKDERYTPVPMVKVIRAQLGGIELDPMTCEIANEVVRAERIYTRALDGFAQSWACRSMLLNPPGSMRQKVADKFARAYRTGDIRSAAVIHWDWDHSTRYFRDYLDLDPTIILFDRRWKFSGKDVGRSQSAFLYGVRPDVDLWGSIGGRVLVYSEHANRTK